MSDVDDDTFLPGFVEIQVVNGVNIDDIPPSPTLTKTTGLVEDDDILSQENITTDLIELALWN